jgi:hypothetical protein
MDAGEIGGDGLCLMTRDAWHESTIFLTSLTHHPPDIATFIVS